jgi:hypothetical protein
LDGIEDVSVLGRLKGFVRGPAPLPPPIHRRAATRLDGALCRRSFAGNRTTIWSHEGARIASADPTELSDGTPAIEVKDRGLDERESWRFDRR